MCFTVHVLVILVDMRMQSQGKALNYFTFMILTVQVGDMLIQPPMIETVCWPDLKTLVQTDKKEDKYIKQSNKREKTNLQWENKRNLTNKFMFSSVGSPYSVK